MSKKTKSEQIEWLVDWSREKINETGRVCLDAQNMDLLGEFEEYAQANVGYQLWKSRIRDTANELGLNGKRCYIADATPSAGIPRFIMVYSNTAPEADNTQQSDVFAYLSEKISRIFPE